MISSRALVVTLLLAYGVGVLAVRWLALGAFVLDGPTVAAMVAVPILQASVLIGWRRWSARRRP